MVLVDTSVWIRFFMNREPIRTQLNQLLDSEQAGGHNLVYGELLIGDVGGRRAFLNAYELGHYVRPVPHREVVDLVRQRRLHGRGIGWIDANLLASAMAAGMKLWTADPRFASVAKELGVAYEP